MIQGCAGDLIVLQVSIDSLQVSTGHSLLVSKLT